MPYAHHWENVAPYWKHAWRNRSLYACMHATQLVGIAVNCGHKVFGPSCTHSGGLPMLASRQAYEEECNMDMHVGKHICVHSGHVVLGHDTSRCV